MKHKLAFHQLPNLILVTALLLLTSKSLIASDVSTTEEKGRQLASLMTSTRASSDSQEEDEYDPNLWRRYRVRLDLHPMGYTLHKEAFTIGTPIRMRPSGLPSDKFNFYGGIATGPDDGWEIGITATGARPLGSRGYRTYYGFGVQRQLIKETKKLPALSIGGYGYVGPQSHDGGTGYLALSKRLGGGVGGDPQALFVHAGAKLDSFSNNITSSTGIRPFVGTNIALGRRLFLSSEFSPRQPWETAHEHSTTATFLFHKKVNFKKKTYVFKIGAHGGLRGNGYRTRPFLGPVIDVEGITQ